jgi:hypothetical protein
LIQGVQDYTPTLFEPNVAETLQGVEKPIPIISPPDKETTKSGSEHSTLTPDPFGEVDLEKSRAFTLGGTANALWKVIMFGEKADKTVEGWSKLIAMIGPKVADILDWLQHFKGS